jgi:hypothetical protein
MFGSLILIDVCVWCVVVLLTIGYDCLFYFAHRLLHHPKLYRYHKLHHMTYGECVCVLCTLYCLPTHVFIVFVCVCLCVCCVCAVTGTVGVSGTYMSALDFVLTQGIPIMLPKVIFNTHWSSLMYPLAVGGLNSIHSHGAYYFMV